MGFLEAIFGKKTDTRALLKEGALLLDVRSKNEFKSGHVKGSVNVPLDVLASKINAIKDKNDVVVTVCESGMRSAQAKRMLKKAGLEVYNGGSWRKFN